MIDLLDVRNHTELGTGYSKDKMLNLCADELQSLRQRVVGLEAENKEYQQQLIVAVGDKHFGGKTEQILAQQHTIEKMREALEMFVKDCSGEVIHSTNWLTQQGRKALSIQSSTTELAQHDEAIRLEEREKVLHEFEEIDASKPFAELLEAIRQRKTS